ncbi:MAG: urease accessory protein UreF [Gammaproteobacteria bacterium]
MITDLALLRLLQLVSPGLPIGMYSYSQGMERAVEDGLITRPEEAGGWLKAVMSRGQARVDLPVLARLYDAWLQDNIPSAEHWNAELIACRETAELRAEDGQTGQALARLLIKLEFDGIEAWPGNEPMTLAAAFGYAAVRMAVPKRAAMTGYLWSWLENQVLCAVKLVPLGQVAGQRLLMDLAARIPEQVDEAFSLPDEEIGGSVFMLSLASSRHELQYSRLFRS